MEVINNTEEVLKIYRAQVEKILTALGTKAVDIWKLEITDKGLVDTGRFRNSANFEVNKNKKECVVGTNVEYAPYLEIGTSSRAPRPSLLPAMTDYNEDYSRIIKTMLENANM